MRKLLQFSSRPPGYVPNPSLGSLGGWGGQAGWAAGAAGPAGAARPAGRPGRPGRLGGWGTRPGWVAGWLGGWPTARRAGRRPCSFILPPLPSLRCFFVPPRRGPISIQARAAVWPSVASQPIGFRSFAMAHALPARALPEVRCASADTASTASPPAANRSSPAVGLSVPGPSPGMTGSGCPRHSLCFFPRGRTAGRFAPRVERYRCIRAPPRPKPLSIAPVLPRWPARFWDGLLNCLVS